jgi:predicted aspartyl protease
LAAEDVRRCQLEGIVDRSSIYLVLPARVVEQLGLRKAGEVILRYADRRSAKRPLVDDARVELLGRPATFQALVEPDRTTVLIGAIVLETLDLLVDCRNQRLMPRDPTGIIAEVE